MAGDEDDDDEGADPMHAALKLCPHGVQDVRALPLKAGGAAFFTHRIIHWGSAGRPGYPTPVRPHSRPHIRPRMLIPDLRHFLHILGGKDLNCILKVTTHTLKHTLE